MNFMSYTIIILQMLIQNTYHLLLNGLSLKKNANWVVSPPQFYSLIELRWKKREDEQKLNTL
jgi:hypothetical protein